MGIVGAQREIEFRGKSVCSNHWRYGYVTSDRDKEIYYISEGIGGCGIEVIPESVDQYTGLKDKHGNKIFDGDLCKHPSGIFKVEFKFGGFCLIHLNWHNEKTFFDWLNFQLDSIQIIGNVFDNPELLNDR